MKLIKRRMSGLDKDKIKNIIETVIEDTKGELPVRYWFYGPTKSGKSYAERSKIVK